MGKGSQQDPLAVIASFCPQVTSSNCEITSDATTRYNCVALVLGDDKRWWEPTLGKQYYWPIPKQCDYSLRSYASMFESLGFVACDNTTVENEYEKIVLYSDADDEFTHVAIQSRLGVWSSKLGDLEDVEHKTPEVLSGAFYGNPRLYMKRQEKWKESLL